MDPNNTRMNTASCFGGYRIHDDRVGESAARAALAQAYEVRQVGLVEHLTKSTNG